MILLNLVFFQDVARRNDEDFDRKYMLPKVELKQKSHENSGVKCRTKI